MYGDNTNWSSPHGIFPPPSKQKLWDELKKKMENAEARADKATALLEHFFLESCHHTGEMRPGINREWCFDCASWVYEQDKKAISEARKFLAEHDALKGEK